MTIKTLLAPMTGTKADKRVLDTALTMATFTNAHIHAVFLHREPSDIIASYMGDGMTTIMMESLIRAAEEQAEDSRRAAQLTYDKWRKTNSVAESVGPSKSDHVTAGFTQEIGNLSANLIKVGRLADLVCVLRQNENGNADWDILVEAALIDSGKPVLLAPSKKHMRPIQSIAIAWNGSQEAARAVSFAMPVLEAAENVTVIAGTDEDFSRTDVSAFADSLKWHGINATTKLFKAKGPDLAKRIQNTARKADAQLLVIGAYSHNRLRQFVFGGVTDELLKAGEMPVLMAH